MILGALKVCAVQIGGLEARVEYQMTRVECKEVGFEVCVQEQRMRLECKE